MPLKPGRSRKVISRNIAEFHHGRTYARTKRKFGAQRANKQAVSAAFAQAGRSRMRYG